MNKIFSLLTLLIVAAGCTQSTVNRPGEAELKVRQESHYHLVLPSELVYRHEEFEMNVSAATNNIYEFANQYGWKEFTEEPFMDSVMIFGTKKEFDKTLLMIAGADTTISLPETYCAALENRTLMAVSPEIYASVYPQGIEDKSYEKLLTHEIAHRLHVRILKGDEDAMGPVWFFEGFALFAADQFRNTDLHLSTGEMKQIINDPDRGSYLKYAVLFRVLVKKVLLKELIEKAGEEGFNEWVILKLDFKMQ
ncbi:MAG: hypothetical protein JW731_10090 [Bacteroidales bacterium]|nr:hypothetical protein [Bacteroidales bacterium]